jgi:hypothetical protein
MAKNWYDEGVKAGKTDSWMNLEETLAEDRKRHPSLTSDLGSLVQTGIDGWEETDHFHILYGKPMIDDAKDELGTDEFNDDVIEKWQDNKDSFWEGYIAGRKAKGKDIYALARKLTAPKSKSKYKTTKSKSKKRSTGASGLSSMR